MSEYNGNVEDEVYEDDPQLEDNPLYDALTEPTSSKDTDEDDDSEFEPTEGDSPEVTATKLKAKNRLLRQSAKSNARLKDRVEQLEAQLKDGKSGMDKDEIAALIQAAKGGGDEKDAEEAEQQRIQAIKEQIEEDPTAIVDILTQNSLGLENKLAGILQSRDAYWETKLAEATAAKHEDESPEVMKLVGLLRQKEQYKDVDEATLITFAKDLAPLSSRVKRPPAATGGMGRLPIDAKSDQVEKIYASELDAMGYGPEND